MLLLALVKVITSFSNKNMNEAFNISKGFIRKSEFIELKNELKKEIAVERVIMQESLMQQIDRTFDSKVKEIKNIGYKLEAMDDIINELKNLKEEFKDKISSFNVLNDEVMSLRKEINKLRYGTDTPSEENISRRKG
jgi:predicted RNase H-like nuclease (RuvC/YqgF family)